MAGKSRLSILRDKAEALHRARFIPPMVLWIQNQPTATLTALRHILETGEGNLAKEIERVLNDQNK